MALDAQTRDVLQRELLRIQAETGKTILFVPIFVLMLLGIILSTGVRRVENWIAPWKATQDD